MHGGGGAAEGGGALGAEATGSGAAGADAAEVADATAGAEEAMAGAVGWTDDAGTPGAEAQAKRNPAPYEARANEGTNRRCDMGGSVCGQEARAAGYVRFGSLPAPDYDTWR